MQNDGGMQSAAFELRFEVAMKTCFEVAMKTTSISMLSPLSGCVKHDSHIFHVLCTRTP